ncbi:hypothetical protein Tco_0656801 [Tanacetum coccineum]|uniref:Uncharacterized protein n=1 Tax=Tanacetum coccineum TaxID=301880 RepID=A0ABQ4XA78_9ASTR
MSSYNHFGCSWCGGLFNGGYCPGCSSVGSGNEFVYDPNSYSYNETPNFFNQPPQHQYETYSCEFCGGNPHPGFDCQTGNTPVYDQGPCYNQDFGFDQPPYYSLSQPQHSTVVRSVEVPIIALIVKPETSLENNRILEEILRTLNLNPPVGEPEGSDDYTEVPFDDEQILRLHNTAHVTPPAYTPSLPFLATMEPTDTLLMGDEVISTTPERENDEFIKSSVDDLVPILRESEVTSVYDDLECDMPITIPLPTTDVREEDFDINSPLVE